MFECYLLQCHVGTLWGSLRNRILRPWSSDFAGRIRRWTCRILVQAEESLCCTAFFVAEKTRRRTHRSLRCELPNESKRWNLMWKHQFDFASRSCLQFLAHLFELAALCIFWMRIILYKYFMVFFFFDMRKWEQTPKTCRDLSWLQTFDYSYKPHQLLLCSLLSGPKGAQPLLLPKLCPKKAAF